MHQQTMMKADASGLHYNVDFSPAINPAIRDLHVGALAYHPDIAVREWPQSMASGYDFEAAIFLRDVVERDPGGNERHRLDVEIWRVLMIRFFHAAWRLHKKLLAEELDIRTN